MSTAQKKKNYIAFTLFLALLVVIPTVAFAIDISEDPAPINCTTPEGSTADYCLLTPLPVGSSDERLDKVSVTSPITYINTLFKIGISLAVVFAVFMMVYGGIITMSTDNIGQHREGREIIKRTLWGLLLLLICWLILYTINPRLLDIGTLFKTSSTIQQQSQGTVTTPP